MDSNFILLELFFWNCFFDSFLNIMRGEERFREEGETVKKNSGRREKVRQNIGRRENQLEKGEGSMV